jgi:hypothetical protein
VLGCLILPCLLPLVRRSLSTLTEAIVKQKTSTQLYVLQGYQRVHPITEDEKDGTFWQVKCDIGYSRGTCTPMFIAVLFTIPHSWKQPRCPTTDECIKKFYSALKNEILSFTNKWMELENIILRKVSQSQKTKNCMSSHMRTLDLGQIQQCC